MHVAKILLAECNKRVGAPDWERGLLRLLGATSRINSCSWWRVRFMVARFGRGPISFYEPFYRTWPLRPCWMPPDKKRHARNNSICLDL